MRATCFPASPRRRARLAGALLAVAALATYTNSLRGPFVFDDLTSIVDNPTIRTLWPPGEVLATPRGTGQTVDGRPLLNLSFAFNHAMGGLDVRGYHAANLAIHTLAGLTLFGLVRRTLRSPRMRDRWDAAAEPVAFVLALLWLVHPLSTAAVTYIAQRAESLAGLLYLLTLYCVARGASPDATVPASLHSRAGRQGTTWFVLAVLACLLGAATKETIATAPLLALLYDRTFVAGTFRAAWRRRWPVHLALAATWIPLAWLVFGSGSRAGTAGFATDVSAWSYLLTQCRALAHYLRLVVWPHPLVFDHGTGVVAHATSVIPQALALGALVVGTLVALRRRPVLGFVGAWFFLMLAPSSSVIPVATQTIAEHRMYLPLVAPLALVVGGGYAATGARRTSGLALVAVVTCAFLTIRRNADYASEAGIWRQTTERAPHNPRAFTNLGAALVRAGDLPAARAAFAEAVALDPENSAAHANLGNLLRDAGARDAALHHHREAVRLDPRSAAAHANLGRTLLAAGRTAEALPHLQAAAALGPTRADFHHELGLAQTQLAAWAEAITSFETALRLRADFPEAHYNLANVLAQTDRTGDAMAHYRAALALRPDYAAAHNNLGNVLLLARRAAEAVPHFEAVVRAQPQSAAAHANLGLAFLVARRHAEAERAFRDALRIDPDHAPARENLGRLQALERAP